MLLLTFPFHLESQAKPLGFLCTLFTVLITVITVITVLITLSLANFIQFYPIQRHTKHPPTQLPVTNCIVIPYSFILYLIIYLQQYIGEGNGNPLQCSCLENPRDGRAWWAVISGVAQSQTRLKRLSSSSSSNILETVLDARDIKIIKNSLCLLGI